MDELPDIGPSRPPADEIIWALNGGPAGCPSHLGAPLVTSRPAKRSPHLAGGAPDATNNRREPEWPAGRHYFIPTLRRHFEPEPANGRRAGAIEQVGASACCCC